MKSLKIRHCLSEAENRIIFPRMKKRTLKQTFLNARVETVPDAGHWVHADAPDALLTLVRGFFEE